MSSSSCAPASALYTTTTSNPNPTSESEEGELSEEEGQCSDDLDKGESEDESEEKKKEEKKRKKFLDNSLSRIKADQRSLIRQHTDHARANPCKRRCMTCIFIRYRGACIKMYTDWIRYPEKQREEPIENSAKDMM